jgi:hypothetical protein
MSSIHWVVVVGSMCGCGRVDYAPLGNGPTTDAEATDADGVMDADGVADADAASDAGGPGCAAWGPWSAPRVLEVSSDNDDWRSSITDDGLEIYFHSWRPGGLGQGDLWFAARSSQAVPFEPAVFLVEVSSAGPEQDPFISADGLTLLFSGRPTGTHHELFEATRRSRRERFTLVGPIANVNSTNNEWSPWLSSDGLRLYFNSQRAGTGGYDLWMATRSDTSSPFDDPVELSDLNTTSHERSVALSLDEREIYFGSNRTGGMGGVDIYVATRRDADSAFGAPTNLGPTINTTLDDTGPFVSPDGTTLLMNRNTVLSGSVEFQSDIWSSSRSCS